jgi:hypothetical protein
VAWSPRSAGVSRVAINAPFPSSPATVLAQGIPVAPVWPNFNPGQYPFLAGARITCLFSIGTPGDQSDSIHGA